MSNLVETERLVNASLHIIMTMQNENALIAKKYIIELHTHTLPPLSLNATNMEPGQCLYFKNASTPLTERRRGGAWGGGDGR